MSEHETTRLVRTLAGFSRISSGVPGPPLLPSERFVNDLYSVIDILDEPIDGFRSYTPGSDVQVVPYPEVLDQQPELDDLVALAVLEAELPWFARRVFVDALFAD